MRRPVDGVPGEGLGSDEGLHEDDPDRIMGELHEDRLDEDSPSGLSSIMIGSF